MSPTGRRLWLVVLLAALALLAAWSPPLARAWPALAGLAAGLALFDLALQWRAPSPGLQRYMRHSVPVGVGSPVELALSNRGPRRLRLRVHDHYPPGWQPEGLRCQRALPVAPRPAGAAMPTSTARSGRLLRRAKAWSEKSVRFDRLG